MKTLFVAIFTLFIASAAAAQDLPSKTLTRGTWELGAFAGGGDGFGKSDNTQFLIAGGRGGLVLTKEFMPGILRGNFEWAVDVMPVYIVFPPNSGVYGGSIKPVIWKWNFTHWQKVAPYFAAAGGILFTRRIFRRAIPPRSISLLRPISASTSSCGKVAPSLSKWTRFTTPTPASATKTPATTAPTFSPSATPGSKPTSDAVRWHRLEPVPTQKHPQLNLACPPNPTSFFSRIASTSNPLMHSSP